MILIEFRINTQINICINMYKGEFIIVTLVVFCYFIIALQGWAFFLDASRESKPTTRGTIRLYKYIIAELFTLHTSWKYVWTKNREYLYALYLLYLFFLINTMQKFLKGKKNIILDLLVFLFRIIFLDKNFNDLQYKKICTKCLQFSIDENLHKILVTRTNIKILTHLHVIFTLITLTYAALRRFSFKFLISFLSLTFTKIIRKFDTEESLKIRLLSIIGSIVQMFHLVDMILKIIELNE